jgi:NADPH:quinone reductase-like Zn-dependent oxidoreductase
MLVDLGIVRPLIGREYSLENLFKAHELGESGEAKGKMVIHVGIP